MTKLSTPDSRTFRIAPIKSERDYDAALAAAESLMDAAAGTPRGERLDLLVTLIEAYERTRWVIDPPDPIDAINLRLAERGLTRVDLKKVIGSSGRVSEILNRKRPLTLEMMRNLHRELDIPAESFFIYPKPPRSRRRKPKGA